MLTPSELKRFLSQRGPVPLMDVAHHFHKEPDVVREMLAFWVRKGKVRQTWEQVGCQSRCCGCGSGPAEIYAWVDSA